MRRPRGRGEAPPLTYATPSRSTTPALVSATTLRGSVAWRRALDDTLAAVIDETAPGSPRSRISRCAEGWT